MSKVVPPLESDRLRDAEEDYSNLLPSGRALYKLSDRAACMSAAGDAMDLALKWIRLCVDARRRCAEYAALLTVPEPDGTERGATPDDLRSFMKELQSEWDDAERRAAAAEGHCRNHHMEPCETCIAMDCRVINLQESLGKAELEAAEAICMAIDHEKERRVLEKAIKEHHAQKADDRCIEDDTKLYAAAGLPPADHRVGDKAAMLKNCERFIDRRCEGGGWLTYVELERENSDLRDAIFAAGFFVTRPGGVKMELERLSIQEAVANRESKKQVTGAANCLYCGYRGEHKEFSLAVAETLEHGRTCSKHPMREIERINEKLRSAIRAAGFRVMETSGDWSIYDVSQLAQAEEEKTAKVIAENIDLQKEIARMQDEIRRSRGRFFIQGSFGVFVIDADGSIVKLKHHRGEEGNDFGGYEDVVKFDVEEYIRYNGSLDDTDILLIGYWTKDGKYEPPVGAHRRLIADESKL